LGKLLQQMKSDIINKTKLETHPFLPSGEWEGFYCYQNNMQQHEMATNLRFINSSITGSGADDIAPFSWSGVNDLKAFKLITKKVYSTHQFIYNGDIDENGIWGIWESALSELNYPRMIPFKMTGGFHLWPKQLSKESNQNAIEDEKTSSKKLDEIFLKEFT